MSEEPDSVQRVEQLLHRLEDARGRLEATDDGEAAIDILNELSEIAKEVEAEIERAKREADTSADD